MMPPVYVRDPGQSTWREARDGAATEREKAAEQIRDAMNRISSTLPADRFASCDRDRASAEWVHWNTYHKRSLAFLRVHPDMIEQKIGVPCGHPIYGTAPSCRVSDDAGYYLDPKVVGREPGEEG